jgi:hypothetical protein
MATNDWFTVDKDGLAKILAKRGKEFAVFELIQNAWDTDAANVTVTLTRTKAGSATLTVVDDSSTGFTDLSHAYTLFAESTKKGDSTKRGRFNLGEKLVIALCKEVTITTMTGTVRFSDEGRKRLGTKTERGTIFTAELKLSRGDVQRILEQLQTLLVPTAVTTTVNGVQLAPRTPLARITASLPTEVADDEGKLRRTQRKTTITLVKPQPHEHAHIYEMGIPIVEIDLPYHVDIGQKVPLSLDRDNVSPAFLRLVTTLVFNEMHDSLTDADVTSWAAEASSQPEATTEAVKSYLETKYGQNRVAFDPTSPESVKRAQAAGYQVIHGPSEAKGTWEKIREAGLAPSAGKVFPIYTGMKTPDRVLTPADYTDGMTWVATFAIEVAARIIGTRMRVRFIDDKEITQQASYGCLANELTFNVAHLGEDWFDGPQTAIYDLIIHELGHHYSGDHLSTDYYNGLTHIGAAMVQLALVEPQLFERD